MIYDNPHCCFLLRFIIADVIFILLVTIQNDEPLTILHVYKNKQKGNKLIILESKLSAQSYGLNALEQSNS